MANLKSTSLRFNLEKPVYKKAWEYLQNMDKSQFKSYSYAVAVSVADYFERYYKNKSDPFLENREREEQFITQILETVETALEKTIPNFLTACLAGISRTYPVQTSEIPVKSETDTISDEIDYDFIGG
jgi:uncharacterized protein with ATP-grasp and redox domains